MIPTTEFEKQIDQEDRRTAVRPISLVFSFHLPYSAFGVKVWLPEI